jgi:hypothetical protein
VTSRLAGLRKADLRSLLLSADGVAIGLSGVLALTGSLDGEQGERFLLVVAGLALLVFGLMIVMRWKLSAVRTGMFGLTAGYFATALTEFQVATDPCDIGAALERCATDVVKGAPWVVYQGPLILAVLLFIFIVFEPRSSS